MLAIARRLPELVHREQYAVLLTMADTGHAMEVIDHWVMISMRQGRASGRSRRASTRAEPVSRNRPGM
jgi:hypothetical protein